MALLTDTGVRTQRKALITVAEWTPAGGTSQTATTATTPTRQILGVRTEDSSIELNPDIETVTDILGITYTDVNKTEPQQDFDPFYVIGGSALHDYLTTAILANDIDAYSNAFTVYIIAAYQGAAGEYRCAKHEGCSIIPTSLGGDAHVNMPIEVHYSNNITTGKVDVLTDSFQFTAD